jgi:hypothetical protein
VAGLLHAGAAKWGQLRGTPLPHPALPDQHCLRPHLRQSRRAAVPCCDMGLHYLPASLKPAGMHAVLVMFM